MWGGGESSEGDVHPLGGVQAKEKEAPPMEKKKKKSLLDALETPCSLLCYTGHAVRL